MAWNPFSGIKESHHTYDTFLKRFIRNFRFFVRSIGFACAVVILGLLSNSLALYHGSFNKTVPISHDASNWPNNVKTWPSILTLIIAILAVLLTSSILVLYIFSRKWANRLSTVHAISFLIISMVFFFLWGMGAIILQALHDHKSNDLWSTSCAKRTTSDGHRNPVADFINYDFICTAQKWTSICGFLSLAIELMNILLLLLMYMRLRSKRQLLATQGTPYRVVDNGYELDLLPLDANGEALPAYEWEEQNHKQHHEKAADAPDAADYKEPIQDNGSSIAKVEET